MIAHFVVIPVPDKEATCGDPEALSVIVTAPVLPPVAVGVKVTFSEHVASEANVPPQFVAGTVTTAKSPLATTELIVNVPVPVLVRIMLRTELVVERVCSPNAKDVGLRLTPGVRDTPVPVTVAVCGDPVALSNTAKVAVRVPAAVGVKVTLKVQDELDATVIGVGPQGVDGVKSPVLPEVKLYELIVTLPPGPEVLVKVND